MVYFHFPLLVYVWPFLGYFGTKYPKLLRLGYFAWCIPKVTAPTRGTFAMVVDASSLQNVSTLQVVVTMLSVWHEHTARVCEAYSTIAVDSCTFV